MVALEPVRLRELLGSYQGTDWIKFAIPFTTATIALVFCILFLWDCQSVILVAGEWHGIFTHVTAGNNGRCVSYWRHPLSNLPDDPQLLAAQLASCVVLALGIPLWICLALGPCVKQLNHVWPKIIIIVMALLAGNAQLFTVVKFIRFLLTAYPDEKVHYHHRFRVIGSIMFWLVTGILIPLCGVQVPPPSLPVAPREKARALPTNNNEGVNNLVKVDSEDTHDTAGLELQVCNSQSADTTVRDVENGQIQIQASTSAASDGEESSPVIEMSYSSDK